MAADGVKQLEQALLAHQRLVHAAFGLVVRACAARFNVHPSSVYKKSQWPGKPAQARAAAVYVMVTDFNFSHENAGALLGADKKTVWRMMGRVADAREKDASLDHWLDELSQSIIAAPAGLPAREGRR